MSRRGGDRHGARARNRRNCVDFPVRIEPRQATARKAVGQKRERGEREQPERARFQQQLKIIVVDEIGHVVGAVRGPFGAVALERVAKSQVARARNGMRAVSLPGERVQLQARDRRLEPLRRARRRLFMFKSRNLNS